MLLASTIISSLGLGLSIGGTFFLAKGITFRNKSFDQAMDRLIRPFTIGDLGNPLPELRTYFLKSQKDAMTGFVLVAVGNAMQIGVYIFNIWLRN